VVVPADYGQSVFINCPFDTQYQPIFQPPVIAVSEHELVPRRREVIAARFES
jgi:hypothetical protein